MTSDRLKPERRTQPNRHQQLAYSETQPLMLDERSRRAKAAKIIRVVEHFLGVDRLNGLVAVDVGCSAGFISDELHVAGAVVTGIDIDVPGLERARQRFATDGLNFLEYSGAELPFADGSVDVVIYNHVYEHTADPDAVMTEIRRVLRPAGLVYLGLGNRFGVMEPHYRLPFLSWLPPAVADRYVRRSGRADSYFERLQSRSQLRRMCAGLGLWDYTFSILAEPDRFAASDTVTRVVSRAPAAVVRLMTPVIPTFIWVGTRNGAPRGARLTVPPRLIAEP